MMEFYYLVKGAMIGLIVAMPIGPVSLLCIRRTLSLGRKEGFATGVGATLGDLLYASIAAFGLTFVINFLKREEFWLRLLGGGFLIAVGLFVLFKKKSQEKLSASNDSVHLKEAFGSAFLVDISNPVIILAYLALFSGFGLASAEKNIFSGLSLVIGVMIGAALWWFLLVMLIGMFRAHIDDKKIAIISRVAASILVLFGSFIIYSSFFKVPFLKSTF